MPDFVLGFGLVAVVLIVTALISGMVERSPLSFPLIFLGLGFLLGDRFQRTLIDLSQGLRRTGAAAWQGEPVGPNLVPFRQRKS